MKEKEKSTVPKKTSWLIKIARSLNKKKLEENAIKAWEMNIIKEREKVEAINKEIKQRIQQLKELQR